MRILPPFESVTLRNRRTRYLVNECYLSSEEQANRSYPIPRCGCQTKLHAPTIVKSEVQQEPCDIDDDCRYPVHLDTTPGFAIDYGTQITFRYWEDGSDLCVAFSVGV